MIKRYSIVILYFLDVGNVEKVIVKVVHLDDGDDHKEGWC